MMPAVVRIAGSRAQEVLAIVTVPGADEVRVRWRPGSWRCDRHGAQNMPNCAHTRALLNSAEYGLCLENS